LAIRQRRVARAVGNSRGLGIRIKAFARRILKMRLLKIAVFALFAAMLVSPLAVKNIVSGQSATEAPTGFDDLTNGFALQTEHDKNREEFENEETISEGLGPVYTARSCASCHGQPVTGGASQV